MEWHALIEPAVAERARRAALGHDESLALVLGRLEPGTIGVVRASVASIGLPRTFRTGSGREGRLLRVTLRDATGEADLVLWDDEVRHAATWRPGLALVLRGAVAKVGRDGRCELGLGAAHIEVAEPSPGIPLSGVLVALSPDRPTEAGVQAEAEFAVPGGLATLVVSGATVPFLHGVAAGTRLAWPAVRPHPVLENWFVASPGALPQTAK